MLFLHELAVSCVGWRAAFSLSLSLSIPLSLTNTHTCTHACALSLSHTHARAKQPPQMYARTHTHTHTHSPSAIPLTEGTQEVQPWPNYSVTPRAGRCYGYVFPAVPWSVAPRKKVLSHQPSLRQQAKSHPEALVQLAVCLVYKCMYYCLITYLRIKGKIASVCELKRGCL